ncbi:Uncharacterised protein [Salmonella enterica subsp. enterica serovar Bovismorbificans]|uniref:Uncharacterized protein n=1 Tax=Salmonella enterica subsp. enterica serovar Bovismorbificans TaxID=58097 RepID=A0A655BN67_SALET|nr:Uncharacterised protein [Salmonella enterica subsp. enterica serovar Bovismorbificans]
MLRVDAFNLNGAQIGPALYQAGKIDIRRGGGNAWHLLHFCQRFTPVGPRLIDRFNLPVWNHRQNTVIQLAFETVHRA